MSEPETKALFVSSSARRVSKVQDSFEIIVSDREDLSSLFGDNFYNLSHREEDVLNLLNDNKVDELWCVGYKKLFSGEFIEEFSGEMYNLHPSLLPAFKGLNVYQRVIERGVKVSGATLHTISEEMDEGEIIDQVSYRVPEDVSVRSLKRYATQFKVMLLEKYL